MGGSRSCTSHMTQPLTKLNLDEATKNAGPKLSLKKAFGCNFSAFVKVIFSSLKQFNCMIISIMIPTQLMESNYEARNLENDHQRFIS